MNATTETKPLTPDARKRRPRVVGSPVEFPDGQVWLVPAMPVGPAGDPLAATLERFGDLDMELQTIERRQEVEFDKAKAGITDDETEEQAREAYHEQQDRVRAVERQMRGAQLDLQVLALQLNYDVTEEEVLAIGPDQRTFRKVQEIVAGLPQLDELRQAMDVVKGGGSGN